MNERERVERVIDKTLRAFHTESTITNTITERMNLVTVFRDQLLSIKGLRIEADDQSLPLIGEYHSECGQKAQQDMLEAGYVKVVKE